MTDVIKEILDFKENADYKRLTYDELAILKDYITNLEVENKILNLKMQKAIKYIKYNMPYLEEPDDYENTHKMKEYDKSILLNILKGE